MKTTDDPITLRLRHVLAEADMTVVDLALWFDRPYRTMYSWINGMSRVATQSTLDVLWRTDLLDERIRLAKATGRRFFPQHMRAEERKAFILAEFERACDARKTTSADDIKI